MLPHRHGAPGGALPLCAALLLALTLSATGCSQLDECEADSDCPENHHCVKNRLAANRSSYCAYDESADRDTTVNPDSTSRDTNIPPTCDNSCSGELAGVPGSICDDDGELCALDCDALDDRADCDGELANGCEVDTTSDDAHCGLCGQACSDVLAETGQTGVCQESACVPTGCLEAEGHHDLDGDPANGCEVDVGELVDDTLERQEEIVALARPAEGGTKMLLESGSNWLLSTLADGAPDIAIQYSDMVSGELLSPLRALDDTTVPSADNLPGPTTFTYEGKAFVLYSDASDTSRHELDAPQNVVGSDVTLGLRTSIAASLTDAVVLADGGVQWHMVVDDATPPDQLPGAPAAGDCIDTLQGLRKLCHIDTHSLDVAPWTRVRVLDLEGEPLVLVLDTNGGAAQLGFDTSGGTLDAWTIEASSDPIPAGPLDIEPWQNDSGEMGFAVLAQTGAVHFFETAATTSRIVYTETASRTIVDPRPGPLRDLVSLGSGRLAVLADNGLYITSGRSDETEVAFVSIGEFTDGWRLAAWGETDDTLVLSRGGISIYRLPLNFPQD